MCVTCHRITDFRGTPCQQSSRWLMYIITRVYIYMKDTRYGTMERKMERKLDKVEGHENEWMMVRM